MAELLQFPGPAFHSTAAANPPPASTLTLNDAQARIAALDIRRSWLVEAPAGSGKTGLLIQRFLKLLAFGDVQRPGEVLALTFTRKAEAEMRTRVLDQLSGAAANTPLPPGAGEFEHQTRELALAVLARDRELAWHLLDSPRQLNIRTIDSFCAELAGSLPLLSGGTGRLAPVEDAWPLYERAAERTLRELGGPDLTLSAATETVLLHRDASVPDFINLLAEMLGQREQWGELVPLEAHELTDEFLDSEVRGKLERTLHEVVCQGLNRAAKVIGPELLAELAEFAHRVSGEPGHKGKVSPIAVCAQSSQAPAAQADHLDHWLALVSVLLAKDGSWRRSFKPFHLGVALTPPDQAWLAEFVAGLKTRDERHPELRPALCDLRSLPPTRYPEAQWHLVKALCRILRHALAELQLLFAERRICDFTEIALSARSLLRADSAMDLTQTPGALLRHLLVDEMQDTSAGQYELLESLTATWDGATQTVFLVGDPKQSIYGFRQARVERFLRTLSTGRLGDVPVSPLRLTANFRSQAALVQSFNQAFSQILPTPENLPEATLETVDVPFVAATPIRPASDASPAIQWHISVQTEDSAEDEHDEKEDVAADSAVQDAATIRRTIEEFGEYWPKRPLAPGENARPARVAVLARNRAHLAPVIAEFHQDRGAGPLLFRAVDVEALNQRPEILDLFALTRALLHPADRVAWLSILRSPVCGLGLADLLLLTGEGPMAETSATISHLVTIRTHLLSSEGQQLLGRAWAILETAQNNRGRSPFSTHVERTWRSLGADAFLRPDQQSNAHRFLELVRELEIGPEPLSIALLERRLGKLYAEPPAGDVHVELMTIHKAKGLEWDLVLVPALERSSGQDTHKLLNWLEFDGKEAEFVLAPIQGKGEQASTLSSWLSRLQRARETAEAKRLFYVACTRAREQLHLFAAPKRRKDGSLCTPAYNSLLKAAWTYAEPILHQLPNSGTTLSAQPAPKSATTLPSAPGLALAAAAETRSSEVPGKPAHTLIYRIPPGFDPLSRFRPEAGPQLSYPPASALRHALPFARPEGSYGRRVFGNTVHHFLQRIASRLQSGISAETLLKELPGWEPRLAAVLRGEGLPVPTATREAGRALRALASTLQDQVGAWLLSPHAGARSETALVSPTDQLTPDLRADRVFFAGSEPLLCKNQGYLWIIDFKTAERGGRSLDDFLADQRKEYESQMQAYANACANAGADPSKVIVGLYFPLLAELVHWPAFAP